MIAEELVINNGQCGNVLKKIRKERSMTVEQFAMHMGLGEKTVINWELDRTSPKFEAFCDIVNDSGYEVVVRKRGNNEKD